jgi:hypothetical protein
MNQDNNDQPSSNNSEQSQILLDILEQLQNIHITLERIDNRSNLSSPTTANSTNSRPSSVSFPTENGYNIFNLGDKAVINHRFRNQFGIEGTVTKSTRHFVWIETESGETYKKHKRNVLRIES